MYAAAGDGPWTRAGRSAHRFISLIQKQFQFTGNANPSQITLSVTLQRSTTQENTAWNLHLNETRTLSNSLQKEFLRLAAGSLHYAAFVSSLDVKEPARCRSCFRASEETVSLITNHCCTSQHSFNPTAACWRSDGPPAAARGVWMEFNHVCDGGGWRWRWRFTSAAHMLKIMC